MFCHHQWKRACNYSFEKMLNYTSESVHFIWSKQRYLKWKSACSLSLSLSILKLKNKLRFYFQWLMLLFSAYAARNIKPHVWWSRQLPLHAFLLMVLMVEDCCIVRESWGPCLHESFLTNKTLLIKIHTYAYIKLHAFNFLLRFCTN